MPPPAVVYVGDHESQEVRDVVHWLRERTKVFVAATVDAANEVCLANTPLFIVVSECRPGEVAVDAWGRLRRAAPLTPIVCLLGSWSEGELRTGKPWPGAIRVYAHQFRARVGAQLERYIRFGVMSWSPPFTATEEDRLLNRADLIRTVDARTVLVVSKHSASASALCDAIAYAGYQTIWHHPSAGIDSQSAIAAIWDCPAGFAESKRSFIDLARQLRNSPIIALLGFPRAEDRREAMALGAAAVLSKPYSLEALLWQLRECSEQGSSAVAEVV